MTDRNPPERASPPSLPPPPPLAQRFVRYLLGFGVSVAVGLAPYLGKLDIPLFTPLLSIIPETLHNPLLPLSAALMGVLAVVVQWYGDERHSKKWLEHTFRRCLQTLGVSFLALLVVHTTAVVPVPILGGKEHVAFMVGFVRPERPPCPAGVSDARCIMLLTLDPSRVESFWGDGQVRIARLALMLSYLAFTGGFGALVGLLLLKGAQTKAVPDAKRVRRRPPPSAVGGTDVPQSSRRVDDPSP